MLATISAKEAGNHLRELRERYRAPLHDPDGDARGVMELQRFWSDTANARDGVLVVYD